MKNRVFFQALFTNFSNYVASTETQAYPNQLPPFGAGGSFAPQTGAVEVGHLGFTNCTDGGFCDATYRLSFTFAHTASNVTLIFTGFQDEPASNEGWGLDNVNVSVNSVPIPATVWLFGSAVASVGFVGRRRSYKHRA